jgi:predicted ATPase
VARRLLERDQELATLLDAAREAADGPGSVVLLYGEAGIGKTSLRRQVAFTCLQGFGQAGGRRRVRGRGTARAYEAC